MLLNRFLQSGLTEICPSNYGFLEKIKKEKNFEPQIAHLTQIDSPDTHFELKPVLPITVEFPSTIFELKSVISITLSHLQSQTPQI